MKHIETARRIKEALNDKNMKAQRLADLSGVAKASISQYVNGTYKPSNITATKLALVLKVNPLWLMGFDVEKEEIPEGIIKEAQASVDALAKEFDIMDELQAVLEKDDFINGYKFSDDQLMSILRYARFMKEGEKYARQQEI